MLAIELKDSHEAIKEQLSQSRTGQRPEPDRERAMEMAVAELEEHLASASAERKRDVFPRRGDDSSPPIARRASKGVAGQSLLPMFDACPPGKRFTPSLPDPRRQAFPARLQPEPPAATGQTGFHKR